MSEAGIRSAALAMDAIHAAMARPRRASGCDAAGETEAVGFGELGDSFKRIVNEFAADYACESVCEPGMVFFRGFRLAMFMPREADFSQQYRGEAVLETPDGRRLSFEWRADRVEMREVEEGRIRVIYRVD